EGVRALVIECMAVSPELQPLSELRLIRSGLGVITNVRADHLDIMGPTVEDVARALAQTTPLDGHLFTAERLLAHVFERVAHERRSRLHVVDGAEANEQDLEGFSYIEHHENVALALAVCAHLGVDRGTAVRGMQAAEPDPGVLRRYTIRSDVKCVTFVNAFAANHPHSTLLIWGPLGLQSPASADRRIALLGCRADRLRRSDQLVQLVAAKLRADHLILAGESTGAVALRAVGYGLSDTQVTDLGGLDAERVYERVLELSGDRATVVGMGNIVGLGAEICLRFSDGDVAHG